MKSKWFLLLVLFIPSCHYSEKDLYKFDPRELIESEIYLSDIADEIKYIPLDNSFPHGEIYSYKILDSSIYITTKDIGIMELTRDGKFVRVFGAPGRGPGEYHYFWKFDVDPRSKSVYLLDFNIIKVYSKTGQFIRSLSLKEIDQEYFSDLCFYNDKLLISNYIVRGKSRYSWLVLDTMGIVIKKKYNPIPTFDTNMESNGGNYLFNKTIHYWDLYNDTIYSIDPDFNYRASFLFSPGDYRWPKFPIQGNFDNFQKVITKFYRINLIIETLKFRIIQVWGDIVLINKENNKTSLYSSLEDGKLGGFINDLDGGMIFKPRTYFTENDHEYLTELINPTDVMDYVASDDFKNSMSKDLIRKEELEKTANNLTETDNQILVIVRLKK